MADFTLTGTVRKAGTMSTPTGDVMEAQILGPTGMVLATITAANPSADLKARCVSGATFSADFTIAAPPAPATPK